MSSCFRRAPVAAFLLVAVPAHAHLLVTEVGYDPVAETGSTGEFVEILNPGPGPVDLAWIWLANDVEAYPLLVNGPILSGITLGDFVYRFPSVALAAGRVAVVCHDSDVFLAEHFGGGPLTDFTGQPGAPLLFEITNDGEADGVPVMTDWGSNPQGTLSMANNGESVGLATWDGVSDRIQDHDWVCWLTLSHIPNKDFDYPLGIDGPDADLESSFFFEDSGTAHPAPDAPQGQSIHRTTLAEPGEALAGGNGVTGHDETSEDWSIWTIGLPTPGVTALTPVVDVTPHAAPARAALGVWPQPVAHVATLRYAIPSAGRARLEILDVTGRVVARLLDAERPAGTHEAAWRALGARPGVYFVRLTLVAHTTTARLVVVR